MRWYNWFLLVVFVACLLSIVIIGFELEDYKFETTCFSEVQANNFNDIIMALALSLVAGYFIYILTVLIPNREQKDYTRRFIILSKVYGLYGHIDDIRVGIALIKDMDYYNSDSPDKIRELFKITSWNNIVPYKCNTILHETQSYKKDAISLLRDIQLYSVFFNQEELTLLSKIESECNTFFSQLEFRVKRKGLIGIDEAASNYIAILDTIHLLQTKLTPKDPNQL